MRRSSWARLARWAERLKEALATGLPSLLLHRVLRELGAIDILIHGALGQQRRMVAAASQGTAVENENLICLADAGDALGNDKDRCIVQLVQGLAQRGVCCVVQRAGAVVQD